MLYRQRVINAAEEIGKRNFETVQHFFDKALFDKHHAPCNAVIGSKVIAEIKNCENKQLVVEAIEEILDVHYRYRNFSAITQEEARKYTL